MDFGRQSSSLSSARRRSSSVNIVSADTLLWQILQKT
jgi:hypothetical protein